MTGLSQAAIRQYQGNGYVSPIQVLSPAQADGYRRKLEANEACSERLGTLPPPWRIRIFSISGEELPTTSSEPNRAAVRLIQRISARTRARLRREAGAGTTGLPNFFRSAVQLKETKELKEEGG